MVWFGERYRPGVLEEAYTAAEKADLALVIGTSGRVWPPVAIAFHAMHRGAYLIDVNPEATGVSLEANVHLEGRAGEVLPSLWEEAVGLR